MARRCASWKWRKNVNRSVGAMLSGAVTKVHPEGLPDDTIRIHFEGTGGQSFGAFLCKGITLNITGEANDYTGKGLSGGRVIVRPSHEFRGVSTANTIVGNTVMFGATGARPSSAAWLASALPCACRAPRRWSKAWVTTAANT